MKIKVDFITNSSSSSYICIIPKSFNIRELLTIETVNKYDEYGDEEMTSEELEKVISDFEEVRNGGEIWMESKYRNYHVLNRIIEEKDFAITSIDGGPDENKLIFLNPEEVKKRL